jgi:hypothetical protein
LYTVENKTEQYLLTTAAGKRLIAKAVAPLIIEAIKSHTVVIMGGTTNGYIAEEVLSLLDKVDGFSKSAFFRGATFAPGAVIKKSTDAKFNGDIIIKNGEVILGKTIFDVAESLEKGDIILKGANAVNVESKQAGILIGNPASGTCLPILQVVAGKRVELIIPVGLEKRVTADINRLALKLNAPSTSGLRMMPVIGRIITELDAIEILCGANAELFAAGGVCGAQGSCWIAVTGNEEQLGKASEIIKSLINEPPFEV